MFGLNFPSTRLPVLMSRFHSESSVVSGAYSRLHLSALMIDCVSACTAV